MGYCIKHVCCFVLSFVVVGLLFLLVAGGVLHQARLLFCFVICCCRFVVSSGCRWGTVLGLMTAVTLRPPGSRCVSHPCDIGLRWHGNICDLIPRLPCHLQHSLGMRLLAVLSYYEPRSSSLWTVKMIFSISPLVQSTSPVH